MTIHYFSEEKQISDNYTNPLTIGEVAEIYEKDPMYKQRGIGLLLESGKLKGLIYD